MRPELRSIGTIDLHDTVAGADGTFAPINRTHFAVLIDAHIGPTSGPGEELFRFTVCTPSWMENEVTPGGTFWLRHCLLVEKWDYNAVKIAVAKLCEAIDEPTWEAVATKLSRYMSWEFEDYRPPDWKT